MNNVLFQAICRTGIFMICAQALVHFRPREDYEKYLKLLVSVMILIQLFLPIGSFLMGDNRQEAARQLEVFSRQLEQELQKAQEAAAETDSLLEKMTLEEVRRRMEEQQAEKERQALAAESGDGEQIGEKSESEGETQAKEESGEIRIEIDPVKIQGQ